MNEILLRVLKNPQESYSHGEALLFGVFIRNTDHSIY